LPYPLFCPKKLSTTSGIKEVFGAEDVENLGKLRAEQFSFYPLLYEGEE